jgi:UDP-N-acetylmuramoyl-L-alanyl-D-glutamate--2,6-diaminopimelate ligase
MVDEQEHKATHTTPDSLTINHYLMKWLKLVANFVLWK